MSPTPMTPDKAVWRLRCYFRRQAQHPDDCQCECCEAVEVLDLFERNRRGSTLENLLEAKRRHMKVKP